MAMTITILYLVSVSLPLSLSRFITVLLPTIVAIITAVTRTISISTSAMFSSHRLLSSNLQTRTEVRRLQSCPGFQIPGSRFQYNFREDLASYMLRWIWLGIAVQCRGPECIVLSVHSCSSVLSLYIACPFSAKHGRQNFGD